LDDHLHAPAADSDDNGTAMSRIRDASLLSARYRSIFIVTSFLVTSFNFADRAVFAVTAQQVKVELKLTDFQLGILQGLAFALLYAVLGLPIGRLAECTSRVRIIATAVLFWSAATAACAVIGNFIELLLCRVAVGMGEAGSQPPTVSLAADLFPRDRRASAMSLIMLGTPAGTLLGATVGGAVAGAWGWRAAFLALGIPGLVTGLIVLLLLREPRRGLVDEAPPARTPLPSFLSFLQTIAHKRGLSFVIAGGALAGFGMTSISQFLAVFLARAYHLPVREAGTLYGTISAFALAIGLLAGSFGTDWLARRGDGRWSAWGPAIGLCTAPIIYWIAFTAPSATLGTPILIVAGSFLLLFYGPTTGMIQNMLEPRMRATGAALFGMLYTIIGSGLGPPFVGWMSDRYAGARFSGSSYLVQCPGGRAALGAAPGMDNACAAAAAEGLKLALMTSVGVFFIAGTCYLIAARTIRRDYYVAEASG
jgi:predicted MFS family arabinose efflux permease